jgi:hypothetical protein
MRVNKFPPTIGLKLWVAVRFIVFGLGGFVFMLACWVSFIDRFINKYEHSVWPLVLAALTVVGAVLMLYGVGEWGRWVYLCVFLSAPLSMLLWFLPFYPRDKMVGALTPPAVTVIAYILARKHYSKRHLNPTAPG